jgi:hypothetical protein
MSAVKKLEEAFVAKVNATVPQKKETLQQGFNGPVLQQHPRSQYSDMHILQMRAQQL